MRYQNGDSIGEYVVTGHLGCGGSGEVFLVEHSITGRMEALKLLPSGIDEQRLERILREAKMQARLDHPNITALHNAFWWKGDLALVMELVLGDSLRVILEQGPLDFETALGYARQILRALNHAHRRQVIHRDITPSNVLISENGLVKITDFGLAKEPADRRITQTGAMLGTIHYCSPEQVRSSGEVDHRSDIYSAAVVMYEMFTGQRPFEGANQFELMLAQTQTAPTPPSKVNPALPAKLDACLLRAMEKDPEKRYWVARQFLDDLDACQRRAIPTYVYVAAGFIPVALILGAVARPAPDEIPIDPPPMPVVAIQVPPIPLPPLNVPSLGPAAPQNTPRNAPVTAPARSVQPKSAVRGQSKPMAVVIHTPGSAQEPAYSPAPVPLPPELVEGSEPVPPAAGVEQTERAATSDRMQGTEERLGLWRGVARRLNILRKR
ncbi:MAG: protein kinase [Acidobacteria bacterium]|nr:protein kinase [Acidobacteriota bacterium]